MEAMTPAFYHVLHVIGAILVFVGIGSLLSSNGNARTGAIYHGIGLLILLIAGFGLIAKLKIVYTSTFVLAKLGIWLALGFLPVLAKKRTLNPGFIVGIAIVLGATAAYLGYTKALI
jgi:NAD/NADP transhydrogenase beta subunit